MSFLAKIRKHCMAKPGVVEDEPWPGDTAWKVKGKIFAITGDGSSLTVKSTLEKQAALVLHPNISRAAYVGRFGWVTIAIEGKESLELALELIDESYDSIATPKKPAQHKASRKRPASAD